MVGSLEESEELVQETFLRAWRRRSSFRRESPYRTWLYEIATNVCLDALRRRKCRVLPTDLGPAGNPADYLPDATDAPWLQPYPDRLSSKALRRPTTNQTRWPSSARRFAAESSEATVPRRLQKSPEQTDWR
jgi:RNA polymerase sigma factor (sigma-70 family)